jgi:hypothetical protein
MAGVVLGIPQSILQLVQTGLLERSFHDALYPALLYRSEAMAEEWQGHTGTQYFMSRPSLLAPVTVALSPGQDPVPQTLAYEQWAANLVRYGSAIDTHMPTSVVSNADQFMRNIQQLGLQAGQSVNRVARNAAFQAYISGQSLSTVAGLSTDTQIQVASVNGFTSVVLSGSQVRPVPVSTTTPLPITIVLSQANIISANVVGYSLNNPSDPNSPGVLFLQAALGQAVPARTPVLSGVAPQVIRCGGGNSVDAITSADTVTLQDFFNAVAVLRANNVQPHEDGFYHAHVSPQVDAQLYTDPVYQRLHTALPNSPSYVTGVPAAISNVRFFVNAESPNPTNTSSATSTGTLAQYNQDVGGETINNSGITIQRTLITGKGALYEKWLNEDQYISEAGVTGKIGEFSVINNGIAISTERIRLVIRSPIDRLQDIVSAAWSISTCFPVPSDITALSSASIYKRMVVIESST